MHHILPLLLLFACHKQVNTLQLLPLLLYIYIPFPYLSRAATACYEYTLNDLRWRLCQLLQVQEKKNLPKFTEFIYNFLSSISFCFPYSLPLEYLHKALICHESFL